MSAGSQANLTARIFFRAILFDIHSLLKDIFSGGLQKLILRGRCIGIFYVWNIFEGKQNS